MTLANFVRGREALRADPLAATRRVDEAEAGLRPDDSERYFREQRDYRYAGALNALANAKAHSGVAEWTGEDVARLFEVWRLLDATVTGNEGEETPNGFGVIARSVHQQKMAQLSIDAARRQLAANAANSAEPDSSEEPTDTPAAPAASPKATGLKGA
jgi:hypothetical protein